MKITTICFLVEGENILLAEKKEGFGAGYLNGYGGKKREGETIEKAAVREIEEESGVSIIEADLEKMALINFYEENNHLFECHIFFVRTWTGAISETKEMRKAEPYPMNDLPYEHMWSSDKVWLPVICTGKKIKATIVYKKGMKDLELFDHLPL